MNLPGNSASAGGLRIEHVEPVRSMASIVEAALVAAVMPGEGWPR
jgi:hypothetical protein